jgi:hypothetical protein
MIYPATTLTTERCRHCKRDLPPGTDAACEGDTQEWECRACNEEQLRAGIALVKAQTRWGRR